MGSRTGVPASKWLITRVIGSEHWKHLSRPIRVVPFQTYGTKTLSILVVILSYESCFAYYWGKFGCFSLRLLNFRSVISCWRKGTMRMLLKMWKKAKVNNDGLIYVIQERSNNLFLPIFQKSNEERTSFVKE